MNKSALLHLNDEHFKKTAKRLKSKINESKQTDFKISEIQELLAESLGFRNLHDLQLNLQDSDKQKSFISKDPVIIKKSISDLSHIQCTKAITLLMKNTNPVYYERASLFLSHYIECMYWYSHRHQQEINSEYIKRGLELTSILTITFDKEAPAHIVEYMQFYLSTLPGYDLKYSINANLIKEDRAINEHKNILMLIIPAFRILAKIEKDNFIIHHSNWITNKDNLNKELPKHRLEIEASELYKKSWLEMKQYDYFIRDERLKGNIDYITFLDLIIITSEIMNPDYNIPLKELINILIDNYEFASDISKEFDKISKL